VLAKGYCDGIHCWIIPRNHPIIQDSEDRLNLGPNGRRILGGIEMRTHVAEQICHKHMRKEFAVVVEMIGEHTPETRRYLLDFGKQLCRLMHANVTRQPREGFRASTARVC